MRRIKGTRFFARLMAFLLCGSMAVTSVLPAAAKKKKDDKDKVETVYVNADAEGRPEKVTVSEQLKSHADGVLED